MHKNMMICLKENQKVQDEIVPKPKKLYNYQRSSSKILGQDMKLTAKQNPTYENIDRAPFKLGTCA